MMATPATPVLLVALAVIGACASCRAPTPPPEPTLNGDGAFGRWITDQDGLPAYSYTAACGDGACRWRYNGLIGSGERESDLHWFEFGNGYAVALGYNTGSVSLLLQENLSYLVLNRHRPEEGLLGGGIARVLDGDRTVVSDYVPPDAVATSVQRTFGVGYFRKRVADAEVELDHVLFAPAGSRENVLVSLTFVRNGSDRTLTFSERWEGRPLVLFPFTPDQEREERSDAFVSETVIAGERATFVYHRGPVPAVVTMAVETTAGEFVTAEEEATVVWRAPLPPGETTFCILFGPVGRFAATSGVDVDCDALWRESRRHWTERVPEIEIDAAPWLARELRWGFAFLDETFPCYGDGYRSGETFNGYSYTLGGSLGASETATEPLLARDQFLYAIALTPWDPDFARRLLAGGLVGVPEDPAAVWWQVPNVIAPSDQPLYLLWALAEYVYASGDFAFLDEELPYFEGGSGTVWEHALKAYRYLVDQIGLGPTGHFRVLDGDWNDALVTALALVEGADRTAIRESAESMMNSAMAAYVLPQLAPLAERRGDDALADELRGWHPAMCDVLAKEWNGSWYARVRLHGTESDLQGDMIGWDRMYLEPQPWVVISGCSDEHGTTEVLLDTIWDELVTPSALAAPLLIEPVGHDIGGDPGDGHDGGVWPVLNGFLIWAYALHDPERAWQLLQRNSLARHADAYPEIWTGIWGGFDAWNAWFSARPGWTWEQDPLYDMNAVPMGNPVPHSAQLAAFVKALGIHFSEDGLVRLGSSVPGAVHLRTAVLEIDD